MSKREALLGVVVGKKGVGKTYTTLEMITNYIKQHNRRVLILDVNNEFGNVQVDQNPNFVDVKAIRPEDVEKFTYHPTIEARRVSVLKEGGGKMSLNELAETLSVILKTYQNGLLLIEDINKFVSDSLSTDLIGSIVTQRHMSVDIITHFQTVGKIAQPKIWGNANWVRFHKCEDTVLRHKSKFAGDITHLQIMEAMVNQQYNNGNKHFYCYLNKDTGKIRGAFSERQFIDGIRAFLGTDQGYKEVARESKRKDLDSGNLIHKTHGEAVNHLISTMVRDYYGNPPLKKIQRSK